MLNKIHEHILDIYRILERNTVTLEENTKSLQEHMKRTAILEKQMQTALVPYRWGRMLLVLLGALAALAAIYQSIRG